jgi:hypothetical protein
MHDLPAVFLLQQEHAKAKSGEELEVFGKQAACQYVTGKAPTLNEAVVETIKHAGLSPEQVKRVIEFANVDAYLKEFNKEGSDHKYIEFDGGPADPSVILKDLNDGGGGTVFDRGTADYDQPPGQKAASAEEFEKVASVDFNPTETAYEQMWEAKNEQLPYANPLQDALNVREKISAIHENTNSELVSLEGMYLDLGDSLFKQVKQASLDGMPLSDIVQAWGTTTDNPEFVKAAFALLSPRLLENGVFSSKTEIGQSLTKRASAGIINEKHPLIKDFSDYCEVLEKMAHLRIVRDESASHLDGLNTFLKQAGGVADAARKGLGKLPGLWGRARDTAAEYGGKVTRGLAKDPKNPGAIAKGIGGAVKYSPHIAGGLAAEEAYQQSRYNRPIQAAKNFVLARIPYTHPHMVRQYSLQQRAI